MVITSTYRTEEEQGRVMLANLMKVTNEKPGRRSMYKEPGRAVEAEGKPFAVDWALHQRSGRPGFDRPRPYTQSKDEAVSAMVLEIHSQERIHGTGCVSYHRRDPQLLNAIDMDPYFVDPHGNLIRLIRELTLSPFVSRIGLPGGVKAFSPKHFVESVGCIHVEIPQPQRVMTG